MEPRVKVRNEPWSTEEEGNTRGLRRTMERIAAQAVHEHEAHDHPGKPRTHVTVVSHAPDKHVVHNDHTGMSVTHTSARKARAAAREMRRS